MIGASHPSLSASVMSSVTTVGAVSKSATLGSCVNATSSGPCNTFSLRDCVATGDGTTVCD